MVRETVPSINHPVSEIILMLIVLGDTTWSLVRETVPSINHPVSEIILMLIVLGDTTWSGRLFQALTTLLVK